MGRIVTKSGKTSARVWKDARGRVLEPGTRVAYNYSGDVASGTIRQITKGGEFHIERDPGFYGTNPISKVKHVGSVLAIDSTIHDALKEQQTHLDAMTEAKLAVVTKHFSEQTDNAKLRLLALLEKIADAWDLDEVQMYAEELFEKDIHNPEYREEIVEKMIGETSISKELRNALDTLKGA